MVTFTEENLNQKNGFFWSNPYKVEVIIEMLELPNFDDMTTSTIEFQSRDKILLFKNDFILRRPGAANFVSFIKIVITMIKATFEDSVKVKEIIDYVLKYNFYLLRESPSSIGLISLLHYLFISFKS